MIVNSPEQIIALQEENMIIKNNDLTTEQKRINAQKILNMIKIKAIKVA